MYKNVLVTRVGWNEFWMHSEPLIIQIPVDSMLNVADSTCLQQQSFPRKHSKMIKLNRKD